MGVWQGFFPIFLDIKTRKHNPIYFSFIILPIKKGEATSFDLKDITPPLLF
jgi:hypothetical protein